MSTREQLGAFSIVAVSLLSGMLEIGILAMIGPIVYVLFDPESLSTSKVGTFLALWIDLANQTAALGVFAAAIVMLMLVSASVRLLTLYISERHSVACRTRLANEMLEQLVAAPIEWSQRFSTAAKLNLIQVDVSTWRNDFLQNVMACTQSLVLILMPAIAVVAMAPSMGIGAIAVTAALVAGVVGFFRKHIRRSANAVADVRNVAAQRLMQVLAGLREVKLSGNRRYFVDYFATPNRTASALGISARIWAGSPGILIHTMGQIGFLATAFALWATSDNAAGAAATMAIVAVFFARVLPVFNAIGNSLAQLFRSAPIVHSILEVLSELEAVNRAQAEKSTIEPPASWRRIALERVQKTYLDAEHPALAVDSVVFERGKVYGLVGRSGSGKSTLANILAGLVSPTSGRVSVDDVDLASIDLRKWHRSIGYVAQAPFLFDATIVENVTCGEQLDNVRLAQVLEEVQLAAFVAAQPRGLDTHVGERGGRMSGGQIQRVSIARAVYRRPSILIFDEATSALDGETEREIQSVLAARAPERLTLIIAHRINTLKECDEIVVLEDGKVKDRGTFQTLSMRSPEFKAMLAAHVGAPDQSDPKSVSNRLPAVE
ncbi:MAG: ABC transporter ATP-binding protein [Magnetospirillum sp.]|nr:ABC transporter ATP-binding protein [Magnetospirillum sp.]